jgi:DnaJ-class molecular chaperone
MTDFDRIAEAFADEFGRTPPMHWEVCGACSGRGIMTLKRLAISSEDFDADPDFREDYFNGVYDEPCDECRGRTTVSVIDESRLTTAEVAWVEEWWADERDYAALVAMERRMGC